jgi:hypothetical protein
MLRHVIAAVVVSGLIAGNAILAQDGNTTLQNDAVQASPEQIAAEMRGVAERQKVPYLVVQMADALGTWRGIGGRETLLAVNYFEIVGDGTVYTGTSPGSWNRKDVTGYIEQYDFLHPARRVIAPDELIRVNAGDQAWTEQGAPGMNPSDPVAGGSLAKIYVGLFPHGFMHAAVGSGERLKISQANGVTTVLADRDGHTFTAVLDNDWRPASISTRVDDPAHGRGVLTAEYSNYVGDVYGVFTPRRIVRKLDGKVMSDIRLPQTPTQNPYVVFPTPDVLRGTAKVAHEERRAPTSAASTPRRANGVTDLAGYWQPRPQGGGPPAAVFGPAKPTVDLGKVDYAVNIRARKANFNNFENDSGVLERMEEDKPVYKPAEWSVVRNNDLNANQLDPTWKCWAQGIPRMGPPQRIFQEDAEIVFLNTDGTGGDVWRIVPVDGRERDPIRANDQAYNGDALGRWEGDELVVETVGFSTASWLDWRGYHHSTSLKVTERFRRIGDDLYYNVKVEDPEVLLQPWVLPERVLRINRDLRRAQILQDPPCLETDADKLVDKQRG